jgi:hypothetical protein
MTYSVALSGPFAPYCLIMSSFPSVSGGSGISHMCAKTRNCYLWQSGVAFYGGSISLYGQYDGRTTFLGSGPGRSLSLPLLISCAPTPIYSKPLSLGRAPPLSKYPSHSTLAFTHFLMGEDQGPKEYSFQVVTFPKTVPPLPQNRATMPRDFAVGNGFSFSSESSTHNRWPFQTHPVPEIPQGDTFVPPLASQEANLAPYEPQAYRGGYAQYYGSISTPVSLFTSEKFTKSRR